MLPWSAKAEGLLREQYAPVGAAARAMLGAQRAVLDAAGARGADVSELAARTAARAGMADGFVDAYRRYCWPVRSVDDLRFAPFQVLAAEGRVHALRPHPWHLEVLGRLVATDADTFRATGSTTVDLADEESAAAAVTWWEELTGAGGEGMVVKPIDVIHRGRRGVAQPASSAGDASTCASSTGRSTPRRRTSAGSANATWAASGRWRCASSRSPSSRWSAAWPASRAIGCTGASSPSWRGRANRATPPTERVDGDRFARSDRDRPARSGAAPVVQRRTTVLTVRDRRGAVRTALLIGSRRST
jgi:hypothetical protein